MSSCKDCRNWTPNEYKDGFGTCAMPGDGDCPDEEDAAAVAGPYGDGGELNTRPDFSCSEYEPRDETKPFVKLTGYKSPGRRAERDHLRMTVDPPVAVNCPDLFAEDREFMRLFRESKRIEGIPAKRDKFNRLITQLRARGTQLMKQKDEHAA